MLQRFAIEETVREYRAILQIDDFPDDTDVWRLAAYLQDRRGLIYVDLAPCSCAFMQRLECGLSLISIPEKFTEEQKTEALLEEIGHAVLGCSTPGFTSSQSRLARQWEEREETWVEMFRLMWKLPSELVLRYLQDERGLIQASGCSPSEVRKRCKMLI